MAALSYLLESFDRSTGDGAGKDNQNKDLQTDLNYTVCLLGMKMYVNEVILISMII